MHRPTLSIGESGAAQVSSKTSLGAKNPHALELGAEQVFIESLVKLKAASAIRHQQQQQPRLAYQKLPALPATGQSQQPTYS